MRNLEKQASAQAMHGCLCLALWQEFCLCYRASLWLSRTADQPPAALRDWLTKCGDVLEVIVWEGSLFLFPFAFWAFWWRLAFVFSIAPMARDAFFYLLWLENIRRGKSSDWNVSSKRNGAKNCTTVWSSCVRLSGQWCYPSLLSHGWSTSGSLGWALLPKFQLIFFCCCSFFFFFYLALYQYLLSRYIFSLT